MAKSEPHPGCPPEVMAAIPWYPDDLSVEEIRESLGVDSLGYLSIEALRSMARELKHGICDACFSDEYPVPIEVDEATPQLSLFRPLEDEPDDVEDPDDDWPDPGRRGT